MLLQLQLSSTYLFVDEELVQFISRHGAVAINIDDVELVQQLPPHVVLDSSLFDTLIDCHRIGQTLAHVLMVNKWRGLIRSRSGRNNVAHIRHFID